MRIPCDAAGIKGFVFPRLSCLREYWICSGLNSFTVLFLINPLEYFIFVLNLIFVELDVWFPVTDPWRGWVFQCQVNSRQGSWVVRDVQCRAPGVQQLCVQLTWLNGFPLAVIYSSKAARKCKVQLWPDSLYSFLLCSVRGELEGWMSFWPGAVSRWVWCGALPVSSLVFT